MIKKTFIAIGIISGVSLAFCLFAHRALAPIAEAAATPQTVQNVLLQKGIYFGTVLGQEDMSLDAPRPANYLSQIGQYFDLYTIPAFMFDTEPNGPGGFDFSRTDRSADFAVSHGAKIRGHNLVWGLDLPAWVKNGNYTPDQLQSILKNHVQTVVAHYAQKYPGQVIAWDVINEPVCDDGEANCVNGLRTTIWSAIHKPGSTDPTDYISLALQWAHQADPNAKLYINEYDVEYPNAKMDRLYSLLTTLRAQGTPIDGVGFQSHVNTVYTHTSQDLVQNMNRVAGLGLQSEVTELDVAIGNTSVVPPYALPQTPESLNQQATIYQSFVDACIRANNCNAVVVWGVWDPVSWLNDPFNGATIKTYYPDLLDNNFNPKPAFQALVNEVNMLFPVISPVQPQQPIYYAPQPAPVYYQPSIPVYVAPVQQPVVTPTKKPVVKKAVKKAAPKKAKKIIRRIFVY